MYGRWGDLGLTTSHPIPLVLSPSPLVPYRSQCVHARQSSSTYSSGVPQGFVLGPLLFTAYISPISNIASRFGISLQQYADDTHLYISTSLYKFYVTWFSSTFWESRILLVFCSMSFSLWYGQNVYCHGPSLILVVRALLGQLVSNLCLSLCSVEFVWTIDRGVTKSELPAFALVQ